MEFVFLRHGITDNLEGGLVQGWSPTPLSERGRQQAQAAGERLAAEGGVTALYSSPVARTMETARIVGAVLGLPVQEMPCLAERRMPSRFWGVDQSLIGDYLAEFAAHTHEADWAYEDEDSLGACIERSREVLSFLRQQAGEPGRAVLVSHGTIMRFIMATLLLPAEAPAGFWADVHGSLLGPQPCAFALVAPGSSRLGIRGWNDTAHLAGLLDFDQGPGA